MEFMGKFKMAVVGFSDQCIQTEVCKRFSLLKKAINIQSRNAISREGNLEHVLLTQEINVYVIGW